MNGDANVHAMQADVIVRAYGDEPVRMVVLAHRSYGVDVARPGSKRAISMANGYVYVYREDVYERLRVAYESGDTDGVRSAWSLATPIGGTTASSPK